MAVECVYTRFHSYDFEKDKNFLNGLKTLHMNEEDRGSMLKLKIFFYSRFVEPITIEGYQQWITSHAPSPSQATEAQSVPGLSDNCSGLFRKCEEETVITDQISELYSIDICYRNKDEASMCQHACTLSTALDSGSSTSLSFAEVFQLIQRGEEVPGLQKLDIRPCHQPPTASQMHRRPKPWEKADSP
nr:uncharacterized protein C6orf226 homolog [Paramormyrops kingsleyae]